MAELCRHYGISRPTAYKWLERYQAEGLEGLQDRSRAPLHHPQAVSLEVQQLLLAVKSKHPFWGARKLLAQLSAWVWRSVSALSNNMTDASGGVSGV